MFWVTWGTKKYPENIKKPYDLMNIWKGGIGNQRLGFKDYLEGIVREDIFKLLNVDLDL